MRRKGGGIFEKWFSNFMVAVFTQSLHAIMLAFLLKVLAEIQASEAGSDLGEGSTSALMSVICFVCVTGITRTEKIVKSIFGIQDSEYLRGTKENVAKTAMAIRSGVGMVKNVAGSVKDISGNVKNYRNLKRKVDARAAMGEIGFKTNKRGKKTTAVSLNGLDDIVKKTSTLNDSVIAPTAASEEPAKAPPVNSAGDVASNAQTAQIQRILNHSLATGGGGLPTADISSLAHQAVQYSNPNPPVSPAGNQHHMVGNPTSPVGNPVGNPAGNPAGNPGGGGTTTAGPTNTRVSEDKSKKAEEPETEEQKYYKNQNKKYALENMDANQKLVEDYNKARRDLVFKPIGAVANVGGMMASLGFAAGLDEDLSDIINISNAMSSTMNKVLANSLEAGGRAKERRDRYGTVRDAAQAKVQERYINESAKESNGSRQSVAEIKADAVQKALDDFASKLGKIDTSGKPDRTQLKNSDIKDQFGNYSKDFQKMVEQRTAEGIDRAMASMPEEMKQNMVVEMKTAGTMAMDKMRISPEIDFKFHRQDKIVKKFVREATSQPLKSLTTEVNRQNKSAEYGFKATDVSDI